MNLLASIKDVLFPIECLNCGKDGQWLCQKCLNILEPRSKIITDNAHLKYLNGVFFLFEYDNPLISKMIKTMKYGLVTDIADIFGDMLCRSIKKKELDVNKYELVPVPLSAFKKRWRGFNQSELLAKHIASLNKKPLSKGLLRIKDNTPQAKVGRQRRINNIKNCFRWDSLFLLKKRIILIDDVITTGATLNECAKTLKEAGAKEVKAMVVAKG